MACEMRDGGEIINCYLITMLWLSHQMEVKENDRKHNYYFQ